MEEMDELTAVGRKLFQISDRVEADHQFKLWADNVGDWLSLKFPNSGLSAKWSSLGFSNLTWDNSVGSDQEEWHEFREMVRGRLEWLANLPNIIEPDIHFDGSNNELQVEKIKIVSKKDKHLDTTKTRLQLNSQLALPDKVTLSWLWENVPAKFWIWSCTILLSVFLGGVGVGQMRWVKALYQDKLSTSSKSFKKNVTQGIAEKTKMISFEDLNTAIKVIPGYRDRIQKLRDSEKKGGKERQVQFSSLRQDYQKLIRPYVDSLKLHQPGEKDFHGYKLKYDNPVDLALSEPTYFHLNLSLDFLDTVIGRIEYLRSHPEQLDDLLKKP